MQSLEDWWFEAPVFIEAGVQHGDRVFVFGPVGSGLRTALANADATAINPARGAAENFELLLDKLALELGATVVCAYRTEAFGRSAIDGMARLHPSSVGPVAEHVGFRVWAAAADSWAISGEVDATCYD